MQLRMPQRGEQIITFFFFAKSRSHSIRLCFLALHAVRGGRSVGRSVVVFFPSANQLQGRPFLRVGRYQQHPGKVRGKIGQMQEIPYSTQHSTPPIQTPSQEVPNQA